MNTENQLIEEKTGTQDPKLEFTKPIKSYLDETGRWAKFLSIIAFISIGLMVLMGGVVSLMFAFVPMSDSAGMPFPPFIFGFVYLVLGAVYFLPVLYLFRFANGIQQAMRTKDQDQMDQAFRNLKSHYRFIAIFTIVMFALYLLIFIIMVFAGLFAGFTSGFQGFSV